MPDRTPPAGRARRAAAPLLALVAALALGAADSGEPRIVYDSEFRGYVPVVRGVMRPDLVAALDHGRAPESIRRALRHSRRALARAERGRSGRDERRQRRATRRWIRRSAVVTELLVMNGLGEPVQGARVYRYTDPSFYPANEDETGARLFGAYRFMPYPFPAVTALSIVQVHDEWWQDEAFASVAARGPNIDETNNPWSVEDAPRPRVPIEFVGRTDAQGRLTAISGVFNLRNEDRFARATTSSVLRVGFVVIADGYRTAFSEARHEQGGVAESRSVKLLDEVGAPVYQSLPFRATARLIDAVDVGPERTSADIERDLDRLLDNLKPVLARVKDDARERVRAEVEARLAGRLYRRAVARHRLALAERAAAATPGSAARTLRLARELAARRGIRVPADRGHGLPSQPLSRLADASDDAEADLASAEELALDAMMRQPGFGPAYDLHDTLLAARGATRRERATHVRRLLRMQPFDRWGRARVASALLAEGRTVEAFDHLRYTWAMSPGLGGDDELARSLADHYWRLGLTEKAAVFARLLTGGDPEDPAARVRRVTR